jgi:8-oxo-dGTP pyrophosphatase MutT (NUDIX family)
MNSMADELVRRMTQAERDLSFPAVKPRDAATLILVDRSGAAPKVLLGRRHHGHKFMPGKYVFPGGRVEPIDRRMAAKASIDGQVEARLMRSVQRPSPARARALMMAAIRETFEETGILLGVPADAAPENTSDAAWAGLDRDGIHPALGDIHFVARAITPPGRPRRFDTRFFTADARAITKQLAGVVGPNTELVELVWIPIRETKELDMPAITTVALDELEARVAAGLTHDLPVPFYRMLHRRFSRQIL